MVCIRSFFSVMGGCFGLSVALVVVGAERGDESSTESMGAEGEGRVSAVAVRGGVAGICVSVRPCEGRAW